MNALFGFVTRQRLLVLGLACTAAALGALAYHRLPVDAFPDATNVQVMVLTDAPGMAPEDVERQVTTPIEAVMSGLPRLREVRSLSRVGLSQVVVVFEDEVDTYFARQLVFERLATAREGLAEGLEPELGPVSTGLGEIYQYTLESESRSAMELRTLQDWVVAPRLRAIPGVNEVNSFGGFVKQFHVEVDPARLSSFGVRLREVGEALAANNQNAPGGHILHGWEQVHVRSVGLLRGLEDIEEVVVRAEDGTPVLLRDLATVRVGPAVRQGAVTRDGRGETVAGMVIMLRGESSKTVVDRVRREIPRIQASLPEDVRIETFYDRTGLIQACIDTVSGALFQGGLLVVVVLLLLLWDLRAALTVALSLPLTALVTFTLMDRAELTANLMSLGGLAIAVGMVVDGAIVVTENVVRHLASAEGRAAGPLAVASRAAAEVARPVAFAALIVMVVLLPLLTLEGMEGKMFRPLALAIVLAMASSLLVALLVVPALSSLVLRAPRSGRRRGLAPLLARAYEVVLDRALRSGRLTVGLAAALVLGAVAAVPLLGTEFIPTLDEGAVAVNVVRLSSASLEGSVEVGTALERRIGRIPEVRTVVSKTGRAEIGEDPMGPEQTDLFVMLEPRADWRPGTTRAGLVAEMERAIAEVPGLRPSFSQPIALRVNELLSGVKADVAIKIFGSDLELLRETAEAVGALVGEIPGASDVRVEQTSGLRQLHLEVDRRAIARHHLSVAEVNEAVETAVGGRVVTELTVDQRRFDVLVRFPEERRRDAEAIGRILVRSPGGAEVPLARLTRMVEREGPAQVSRDNGARRVVVEANVRGRDLGGFVRELEAVLEPVEAGLPPGYHVAIGGQFENQQRAMARLAWVVPLSVGLVFLLLVASLGSVRRALVVVLNLPFALVGGVAVLLLLGSPLSVSAAVGFVALLGIAVGGGLVLVTFFDQLRAEGLPLEEAVRTGAALRLRPLLMTSLTTLLGLTPMVLATGVGSEVQRPLAAVVLGGLVTSSLLTLVVLPVVYSLVESRSGREGARAATR